MKPLIGIDGCRAGWICAIWHPPPGRLELRLEAGWPTALVRQAAMVAVDMPIGLPDSGRRDCDIEARRRLPARARSRVFLDLRRPLLDFADYGEANAWGKADGAGLSRQAWHILPKIRELDDHLAPSDQDRVREVHPELVFHHLNAWRLLANKTTAEGHRARLALLERSGLGEVRNWLDRFPRRSAKPDDLLDAVACALAARRIVEGRAACLPPAPPCDGRGLRLEIWY